MLRRIVANTLLAGTVVLIACSCPPPPASPAAATDSPAPAPEPAATPEPAETTALGKQGLPCGDGDACEDGLVCVRYYGIAGTRGPAFKSCEQRCKGDGDCPDGQACVTIADGPGQVCRPR